MPASECIFFRNTKEFNDGKLRALYLRGLTDEEISSKTTLTKLDVRAWRRRFNLTPRRGSEAGRLEKDSPSEEFVQCKRCGIEKPLSETIWLEQDMVCKQCSEKAYLSRLK